VILSLLLAVGTAFPVPSFPLPVRPGAVPTRNGERGTGNVHDLHLTHTRMVVDGRTIALRIRLFKDDLEKALQHFGGRPDLHLTAEARADSLFGAYFDKAVTLAADGKPVSLRVSSSGTETDASSQDVVWYVLEGESGAAIAKLAILNGLMFELFRDQQNLIQLLREPGGIRKTLYFVATDAREQVVSF